MLRSGSVVDFKFRSMVISVYAPSCCNAGEPLVGPGHNLEYPCENSFPFISSIFYLCREGRVRDIACIYVFWNGQLLIYGVRRHFPASNIPEFILATPPSKLIQSS
jgi:hypothetical protein